MPIAQLFTNIYKHNSSKSLEFGETDRLFLENIPELFILNFDETGMQLKQILDARYVDGISGFEDVSVSGDIITGVFVDIVSPSLTKKFNFTINADTGEVDYEQIDTGDLDQEFTEPEFAGKSATCKEGKSSPCKRADNSVYCIALGKKCRSVGLSGEEKAAAKEVVEKAKKVGKTKNTKKDKSAPPKTDLSSTKKSKGKPKLTKENQQESSNTAAQTVADSKAKTEELKKRRQELIDIVGEELVNQAEQNLQKLISEGEIFIRVPGNSVLEKIFDSERFKSTHETGTSGAYANSEYRTKIENNLFTDNDKTSSADKPIYGYVARPGNVDSEEGKGVMDYGDVVVKLKSEAKKKATVSGGDSLGVSATGGADFQPSPLDRPNIASFIRDYETTNKKDEAKRIIESIAKAKNLGELSGVRNEYIEAQIHNQVRLEDIAEITYLQPEFEDKENPTEAIIKKAKQFGIKINY